MNEVKPSFDVVMLATPEMDSFARLAKQTWQDYCERHGYRFRLFDERLLPDLHINWSRIEAVGRTLAASDSTYVVLADADLVVVRPDMSLDRLIKPDADIVFARDELLPSPVPDLRNLVTKIKLGMPILPKTVFTLVRKSDVATNFFRHWLALARGDLSRWADRYPSDQKVLWRSLVPQHAGRIDLFGKYVVVRITRPGQIPYAATRNPFAVHFKHERVAAEDIQRMVPE